MTQHPAPPVDQLTAIAADIHDCTGCPLSRVRHNTVPGEGPANASIMFIGEGPGQHEDQQGRPFVGPAGHFLNQLLADSGLERAHTFITNLVKCRPPQNRTPVPEEVKACSGHLQRQIQAIQPRLIVALGGPATNHFLPGAKVTQVRGQLRIIDGHAIYPILHPAAGLRHPATRQLIEQDFMHIPGLAAVMELDAPPRTPAAPNVPTDHPSTEPSPAPESSQGQFFADRPQ